MEAIFFVGLQASGKSSFFKDHFFNTAIRINLDMLKTRHRERLLVRACLKAKQRFVLDNTNPGKVDRQRYIPEILAAGFDMTAYYFSSRLSDCLARNARRSPEERVPELGLRACAKRLERPDFEEGFTRLYYVCLEAQGFRVEPWEDESRDEV